MWYSCCPRQQPGLERGTVGPGGQPHIRSWSKPWGNPEASDALYLKLQHDNRTAEISMWFTELSLLCANPKVHLIYIFAEDFGGQALSGPASLWSLQELRSLHGQYETLRGTTFLCRITGADSRRPLGILTNLLGLQHSILLGMPDPKKHGSFLHYVGPVAKTCGCSPPHTTPLEFPPMISFVHRFISPLESSSGNSVSLPCEVRWYRYGWRYCGQSCTLWITDLLTLIPCRFLGRGKQTLANSTVGQKVPSILHTSSPNLDSFFTGSSSSQAVPPSIATASLTAISQGSTLPSSGTSSCTAGPSESPLAPQASRA